MAETSSEKFYRQAEGVIHGGVNSPVRSCRAVGTNPLFITSGKGSKVFDVDGNAYIDYVGSWGPLILGHAHPEVVAAVKAAAEQGTSFGIPTTLEVELAQLITELVPSMEMVRMVNSGTEATMSGIRLARGYTGRSLIIKFDGCYHGHADTLLVKAGSGVATLGIPGSAGVPASASSRTRVPTCVSPPSKSTRSPGSRSRPLTRPIVCQAAAGDVPSAASSPLGLT